METSIANQNFRSEDPLWHLLAEFSLSEFLSDDDRKDDPMIGLLFQAVQELGMSPQCMESITKTLTGFASEALVRTKQGRLVLAGRIRIFCQKKMIDDANSAKISKPFPTEHDKKQKLVFPEPRANATGGWGYFSIERGGHGPTGFTLSSENSIDVYLYKEGE